MKKSSVMLTLAATLFAGSLIAEPAGLVVAQCQQAPAKACGFVGAAQKMGVSALGFTTEAKAKAFLGKVGVSSTDFAKVYYHASSGRYVVLLEKGLSAKDIDGKVFVSQ